MTGFFADAELDALIRGAALLVHASLYEGFGLVVAEAMARGDPGGGWPTRRRCQRSPAGPPSSSTRSTSTDLAAAILRALEPDRAAQLRGPRAGRAPRLLVAGDRRRHRRRLPGAAVTTTILVLSVDEAPLLDACLPAALAQPGARVVVIDNACTDGTVTLCEQLGVTSCACAGACRTRRRSTPACAAATGEAVLLLNADCVLGEGFLPRRSCALGRPGSARSRRSSSARRGPPSASAWTSWTPPAMVIDRRRKNGLVGHGEPAVAYARSGEVFGGDGACVLYRREVLDACAVGGEVLDEDMALWASDVDLAWRAQLLGLGVRLRAGGGRLAPALLLADDAAGAPRAPPPAAVPQPLPDDAQERHARGPGRGICHGCSATRSSRSATCCCASDTCCGGYADAWRLAQRCAGATARSIRPRGTARAGVPFGLRPPVG